MKKIYLVFYLFVGVVNVFAQNYYMATPQGYASSATGGGAATPVLVSTYIELKNALQSTTSANAVILVSGTIDCVYTSVLLTNKTIIGLPGARLRNLQITPGNSAVSAANSGILYIKPGSNNVIIRNIIFEGPGAYDVDGRDNLTNEGTNVWVDHCEFQDGIDGNFDNKGQADNVTISWCKFTYLKPAISGGSGGSNDHRFTNLVGSSSTDSPPDGHYSITFQNCYWASGCKERMPRARNAQLHLISCYYNTGISSSKAIGLGGGINNTTCYVENTNFTNINNVYASYIGSDGGTVSLNFNNCINGASNIGNVTTPTYTTTPIPLNDVVTYLTDAYCGAGATLQITNAGIISSSSCAFLNSIEYNHNKISVYPTITTDFLYFENLASTKSSITIYNIMGQKISEYSVKDNETKIKISVHDYLKGVYLGVINYQNEYITIKFIKQ
jgi:pectate lyase